MQWNGSAWVDVDGAGQEGINVSQDVDDSIKPSLVINPINIRPAIAFCDNTSHNISYLAWNGIAWADINGIDRSNSLVFDDGSSLIAGESRILAFDKTNGYPHIVWDDSTLGQSDPYYLEWWIEQPTPQTLPQTGSDLINYLNKLLDI